MEDNPYVPHPVEVVDIVDENMDIKTFTVRFKDEEMRGEFDFNSGQFLQISIPGIGEAPISINSSPTKDDLKLCVEEKGRVEEVLEAARGHDLGADAEVIGECMEENGGMVVLETEVGARGS